MVMIMTLATQTLSPNTMRQIPNDILESMIRHLPLILDNLNDDAVRNNTKLNNAVRLSKINVKRLNKIYYEHSTKKRKRP